MLRSVFATGAAFLLFGSSAVAQGAARACISDINTHCAGVEPGEGRIAGCFKEHFKDLSTVSEFVGGNRCSRKSMHG